jgi:hypothetical protein
MESRPGLALPELPPPTVASGRMVGPYHVLETMENITGQEWLLGYDLRLLRKVWIRVASADTPPVLAALRNIGRTGRLRWLTGRRSGEENWDAFEALSGKPLLILAQERQPWSRVRFWLYDLARELGASGKDGTLPPALALDRVWITADGRAKLLDFPAPGLGLASAGDGADVSCVRFLGQVAVSALAGRAGAVAHPGNTPAAPLPLYARDFLELVPKLPDADTVAGALKPLLPRVAVVTRWRRAAIVAGCLAAPVFFGFSFVWGARMLDQWDRNNPGVMDLSRVLQQRTAMNSRWLKDKPHPSDRQFAIYIAAHYRPVITNEAIWTGAFTAQFIKGEPRRFAEQSIAEHPAPAPEEIKDADAALKDPLAMTRDFDFSKEPMYPLVMAGSTLLIYVCIPGLIAALAFRGGLVLLIARVTFVRQDGAPASRGRLFWRALVVWSPLLPGMFLGGVLKIWVGFSAAVLLSILLIGVLAIISVALPERGLPDRLAGTWPVPR